MITPIKILTYGETTPADNPTTDGEIWFRIDNPHWNNAYAFNPTTQELWTLQNELQQLTQE